MLNTDNVTAQDLKKDWIRIKTQFHGPTRTQMKDNVIFTNKYDPEYYRILHELLMECYKLSDKTINDIVEMCIQEWNLTQRIKPALVTYCEEVHNFCLSLRANNYKLFPTRFDAPEHAKYNHDFHRRISGSDKKSSNILYYVWPVLQNKTDTLGMLYVVTADGM